MNEAKFIEQSLAPASASAPSGTQRPMRSGSPFREGDVVWCVFADGVLGGIYAGSKTFPAKTPGKPD